MYRRRVGRSSRSSTAGAKKRTRVRYSIGDFATSAGRREGWAFLRVGCQWGARAKRENRRKWNRAERELRRSSLLNGCSLVGRGPRRVCHRGKGFTAERELRRIRAS